MSISDDVLVQRVRKGDRMATELLAHRYLRGCRAVALAVTGNVVEAEDVAHDAIIAAIERIDRCREPARFGPWLFQIVRNRARDAVRTKRFNSSGSIADSDLTVEADQPRQLELRETRDRLLEALEQLPPMQREAVLLHDLEGWKHHEVAERLGLPEGTIRSHVHHARRRLRALLTDWIAREAG